jgi:hypothetical protein
MCACSVQVPVDVTLTFRGKVRAGGPDLRAINMWVGAERKNLATFHNFEADRGRVTHEEEKKKELEELERKKG